MSSFNFSVENLELSVRQVTTCCRSQTFLTQDAPAMSTYEHITQNNTDEGR